MIDEQHDELGERGNTFSDGSSGNFSPVTVNDTPGLVFMFIIVLILLRLLWLERKRTYLLLAQQAASLNVD